jgi:hypothetical protein
MAWFPFTTIQGGLKQAEVRVRLELGARRSSTIKFLVDSGAALSMVPQSYVTDLLRDTSVGPEQNLPVQDASGKWLQGRPFNLRVLLLDAPVFPATEERIWVSASVRWPLLGLTWFKGVGVHFQNFPGGPRGQRFALYPCPWTTGASG